jgi:hypothetical protein
MYKIRRMTTNVLQKSNGEGIERVGKRTLRIAGVPALRMVQVEIDTLFSTGTISGNAWSAGCTTRRGEDVFNRNVLYCTAKVIR